MTNDLGGAKIYLKREDLNHTGAHKINNVLGQALLAKMQHRATLPTVTRMADVKALSPEGQALFRLESRCTDLYALGAKKPLPGGAEQRLQIVST